MNKSSFYLNVYAAGCIAGLASTVVASPIELVKIRLQTQTNHEIYKGNIDCMMQMIRQNGAKGLFKGFSGTLYRDVPTYGIFFGAAEFFKNMLGESPPALMFAGGSAGVICWFFAYPMDVVKTRMQVLPSSTGYQYASFIDCARTTYQEGGWRIFYKGMSPCLYRAFPVEAVTFFMYVLIMKIPFM
jgi:solute carrier family 25 carnitine/acylcarnitine transporter 20/29